jgi:hypothetical protein
MAFEVATRLDGREPRVFEPLGAAVAARQGHTSPVIEWCVKRKAFELEVKSERPSSPLMTF